MKSKYIFIALAIILFIIFVTQKKEHAGSTSPPTATTTLNLSNEAVQNIAKVYADTNNSVYFNNINVISKTTLNGDVEIPKWKGMIMMWSGDISKIPYGWALCDGTNDTPDLRGRFILGIGKVTGTNLNNIYTGFGEKSYEREYTFNQGETGGSNKHKLTLDEIPSHRHMFGVGGGSGGRDSDNDNAGGNAEGWSKKYADASFKQRTTNTGSDLPHNNMPPYYVLAYIMKL